MDGLPKFLTLSIANDQNDLLLLERKKLFFTKLLLERILLYVREGRKTGEWEEGDEEKKIDKREIT